MYHENRKYNRVEEGRRTDYLRITSLHRQKQALNGREPVANLKMATLEHNNSTEKQHSQHSGEESQELKQLLQLRDLSEGFVSKLENISNQLDTMDADSQS